MRPIATMLLVCSLLLPLWGCSTNAATGRWQFDTLSRSDEIELGTQAMPGLIEGYGGRVDDAVLSGYVSAIGNELAEHVEDDYRDIPWEFTLLDSEVINAFALPGGKVFVSRGLVVEMTNESQLAAVIGHEIGHVTAEHADQQVSRQMIIQGIAVGASVAAGMQDDERWGYAVPVLVGGAGVFNLKFGRDEELEADRLGMRYMTRAGYNPRGMLELMRILEEASAGNDTIELLSTHPLPERRIDRVKAQLRGEYREMRDDPNSITGEGRFQRDILPRLRAYALRQPLRLLTPRELDLLASNAVGCSCPSCSGNAE